MRIPGTIALLAAATLGLSACALPRGAAVQSEVLRESRAETPDFEVVPVTRAALGQLAAWPGHAAPAPSWPHAGDGPLSSVIRVGDVLDVTIWDSSENSLLTNGTQRFAQIASVEVDGAGEVFLPYVARSPSAA